MTGKTRAKQGRHQHNEVTRIKGKSKNKGVTTTKTITVKITINNIDNKNCSDDGPSNNNVDDIHTGTESVQNKGSRPQSLSDVDFIVNVEGTEQLSCHNIANFEDTIN